MKKGEVLRLLNMRRLYTRREVIRLPDTLRKSQARHTFKVLKWNPMETNLKNGIPRLTWRRTLRRDFLLDNFDGNTVKNNAVDRKNLKNNDCFLSYQIQKKLDCLKSHRRGKNC